MNPDDVRLLRKTLKFTSRELAEAVGVEQKTVLAWENGSLFPTKKYVERMAALRTQGAPPAPPRRPSTETTPMHVLADPDLWTVVRKILTHDKLRADVVALAAPYPDPADDRR